MKRTFLVLALALLSTFIFRQTVDAKKKKGNLIKVLIIDGQSINHPHWKEWTPVLLKQLHDTGLFQIDLATSPMKGESLDKFNPKFKNYDVVVSLYDGDIWSARVQRSFEKYISTGGGLVVIHAADNAFPSWDIYNEMIGLGGWGNRNENNGPYVYIDDQGEIVRDTSPGKGGHHGQKHEFVVESRATDHPIMKDIPVKWLHAQDELYDQLRGPARNMEILATSFVDKDNGGSGRNEPILMTVEYGDGHIFHSTMGHSRQAISCVGFTTTLVRGIEWAANRQVTFEVPDDFPDENSTSSRTY